MFQRLTEIYKWWRHTRTPDHKAHVQKMARLEESLNLCLERHANRVEDLADAAVMRADTLDLARVERILGQLEKLTRECVGDDYMERMFDQMGTPELLFVAARKSYQNDYPHW